MAPWWQGAVVYQVYPRSFADSDGDGIGDLSGIEGKLDYIAALGIDAVWLSPVHPSPNRDFGYDVADFMDIDRAMGGRKAFDALLKAVHQRGLKLILDEVLSHTSDLHPWFQESLKDRTNPKADWYVWAEPRLDGTAPNNWLSVFGGPAWSYFPTRRQYYFHKFLKEQPKLNLRNPHARGAAMDVLRYWLDAGVDGFRLDVANSFLHDDQLRDNPPVPLDERTAHHWAHAPHLQKRTRDSNLPENRAILDEIRALAAPYPDAFVFGEFSEAPELLGHFAGAEHGLHSGYTFTYLDDRSFKPAIFAQHTAFLESIAGLWPCITFSNHDVPRTVTRYGRADRDDALAKLALALLVTLKGTALLYQGEELGLGDGPIALDQIRDPVGKLYFPYSKGRDPCRTPMPWRSDAPHLGFSSGAPWLPMAPAHRDQAVDRQAGDSQSVLSFSRALIAWRRGEDALRHGGIAMIEASEQILAFERAASGAAIGCYFNLSKDPASVTLGPRADWAPSGFSVGEVPREGGTLRLGPRSAYFCAKPR
ncbi:MAG: DUF3459 domain-containing protein [Alphaproteobacteria bacterium]|nr:DUF3459 domain-containing protein [Alphaproteobacteria bacterium]